MVCLLWSGFGQGRRSGKGSEEKVSTTRIKEKEKKNDGQEEKEEKNAPLLWSGFKQGRGRRERKRREGTHDTEKKKEEIAILYSLCFVMRVWARKRKKGKEAKRT